MSKVCLGKSQRKSITKDEGYGEAHRQNALSPVSGGGGRSRPCAVTCREWIVIQVCYGRWEVSAFSTKAVAEDGWEFLLRVALYNRCVGAKLQGWGRFFLQYRCLTVIRGTLISCIAFLTMKGNASLLLNARKGGAVAFPKSQCPSALGNPRAAVSSQSDQQNWARVLTPRDSNSNDYFENNLIVYCILFLLWGSNVTVKVSLYPIYLLIFASTLYPCTNTYINCSFKPTESVP